MGQQGMLAKLERYEQSAYAGGIGSDWLATIGEELKFYVEDCIKNGRRITMSGFMQRIDQQADKMAINEPE